MAGSSAPVQAGRVADPYQQERLEKKEKKAALPPAKDTLDSNASCSCLPTWLQDCFASIGNFFAVCYNWIAGLFGSASSTPATSKPPADPLKNIEAEIACWTAPHHSIDIISNMLYQYGAPFRLAIVMTIYRNCGEPKDHFYLWETNLYTPESSRDLREKRTTMHPAYEKGLQQFLKEVREKLSHENGEIIPARDRVEIRLMATLQNVRWEKEKPDTWNFREISRSFGVGTTESDQLSRPRQRQEDKLTAQDKAKLKCSQQIADHLMHERS